MKNKLGLLALLLVLPLAFFSCGDSNTSSGPCDECDQEPCTCPPYAGVWSWEGYDDRNDIGGQSTSEATEDDGVITIVGEVKTGFQYRFAGWKADPADAQTLKKLKSAKAISFKISGSGTVNKSFKVQLVTSNVTDHGYYFEIIQLPATEQTITLRIPDDFGQPSWAANKPLNMSQITGIQWQSNDDAQGTFNVTMKDLLLIQQ